MPIPTSTPPANPHVYTLSKKQKSKTAEEKTRPLPRPPEPKFPPPPSKPPPPDPKPPDLKNKQPKKRVARRRKDVYVSECDSDSESNSEGKSPLVMPSQPRTPYLNITPVAVEDLFKDDAHMYDSAEGALPGKVGGKGSCAKEVVHANSTFETAKQKRYENVPPAGLESEPSYDENPNLPPRIDHAPIDESPALPPRLDIAQTNHVSAHKNAPNKKLPMPPVRQKPGPTPPPKLPCAAQRSSNMQPGSPKTNLGWPTSSSKLDNQDQLAELSSILSNRRRGCDETFPPVLLKKPHWKRGGQGFI